VAILFPETIKARAGEGGGIVAPNDRRDEFTGREEEPPHVGGYKEGVVAPDDRRDEFTGREGEPPLVGGYKAWDCRPRRSEG
jgi:hypothetical protein